MKVAFQGERGAFSEAAARRLVRGPLDLLPLPSFEEAFAAVARGRAQACVIPIENSLAGSIHRNYDLLLEHRLHIVAEANLRVVHNLIAPRGTRPADLRRVLSHPVALAQCGRFLRRRPGLRPEPVYDTAGSLKLIRERGLRDAAGIASEQAARVYGMRVLARGIQDDPRNFTRFFLLARRPRPDARAEKTSIVFSMRNEPGSLFRCLSVFALRGIDLAKIESRPIPGRVWEYWFYVDFLADARRPPGSLALRHLAESTDFLRVLGTYRRAPLP